MAEAAVTIDNLVKDYPLRWGRLHVRAVDHLSLSIEPNQVFGLLGPNGSGKSTTLKSILGLLRPTSGSCSVFGCPSASVEARRRVGYLPESPFFYRFLTGRELLKFFGRIGGMEEGTIRVATERILEQVRLEDAADRRLNTYSKGMLQRIGLAQALIHDPDLVILDEPTSGVDPVGAEDISQIIRDLKAAGKTVLLCSHLLSHVEALCDRVAILIQGNCVVEGPLDAILAQPGHASLQVKGWSPEKREAVQALLGDQGLELQGIEYERRRLEQLFLEKTREARSS